ncbi:MAG: amidase [Actinomycetota bacterium]
MSGNSSGDDELIWASARDLTTRMQAGALSAREVTEAHLRRIDQVNPTLNAVVTLTAEHAMAQAAAADEAQARGDDLGPLHGLPAVHKDLHETAGIRTTMGSPLFADNVPDRNAAIVQRMLDAGAITVGKSNTPEFGAGSQTFNPVFGATLNPYDTGRTCGGSSGGAAVALATGMVPIADGSDMGGSLRNPASFCNVVGFRTSPGRIPVWPTISGWGNLGVHGPMARTVGDVALFLTGIVGADPRSPISLPGAPSSFGRDLGRDLAGTRVALSPRMGDLPIDPAVVSVVESTRAVFEGLGCEVVEHDPDLSAADDVFQTFRAWHFEMGFGRLLDQHPEQLKGTVQWNVERGRNQSGADVAAAERARTELFHRFGEFMADVDWLVLPAAQVPPFPVETEWVSEIDGVAMDTYIDWMKVCSRITVTSHPAISVPGGFTDDGLPVGIQIVGRHLDDFGVLQLAHAFEQAHPVGATRPVL